MNKPINPVSAKDVTEFCDQVYRVGGGIASRYQELAVRSAIYPGKGTPFGLMYAALGLAEAGEVQNKVKKIFRDDDAIVFADEPHPGEHTVKFTPVSDDRKMQVIKELGGVLWYVAAVCDELGVNIADCMAENLSELAKRSERGTLQGSGDNR